MSMIGNTFSKKNKKSTVSAPQCLFQSPTAAAKGIAACGSHHCQIIDQHLIGRSEAQTDLWGIILTAGCICAAVSDRLPNCTSTFCGKIDFHRFCAVVHSVPLSVCTSLISNEKALNSFSRKSFELYVLYSSYISLKQNRVHSLYLGYLRSIISFFLR